MRAKERIITTSKKSVRHLAGVIIAFFIIISSVFIPLSLAQEGTSTLLLPYYPNCRFGVTVGNNFTPFDPNELSSLNAGWYVNWRTEPSLGEPVGIEHVNLVRLQANSNSYIASPNKDDLMIEVATKPGQTWFVANEPDSIWQDTLWATIYADAYHDLYYLIKGVDPTAKVGIGAIVQPTPLRFQYLDIIWDSYQAKYDEEMPVDVWNIHSFILKEISGDHPLANNGDPKYAVWGAFIPPGPEFEEVYEGILYDVRDMDDVNIFWQRIIDFRAWMAQRGQRNKPLVITEYGVLFPEDYLDEDGLLLSQERVGDFMLASFDLMLDDTDETLGYLHDDNRLVQRWAWFSVDGPAENWGGTLFDAKTGAIRDLGKTYRDYTAALAPAVSLKPSQTETVPSVVLAAGAPVTFTLKADIANSGNISSTSPITVTFYAGDPLIPGPQIGSPQIITRPLAGCGEFTTVSVDWTNVLAGANPYFVQIESADDPAASSQIISGVALAATQRVYLPLLSKN